MFIKLSPSKLNRKSMAG